MRKCFQVLLLAVGLLLAFVPAAAAGTIATDHLLQVFPQAPEQGRALSRGEFAALLARAAGIQVTNSSAARPGDVWYCPAVETLRDKGIIKGYPDGSVHADEAVTLLEAAVMVSRALGLPEGVDAPEAKTSLERESWGYTPYAWLTWAGLVPPDRDAGENLTVDEGIAFLARVFGSDPDAERIVQAAQQAQAEVKDLRFTGSLSVSGRLRPEAIGEASGVSGVFIQGDIESEFSYPLNLHQKMDMTLALNLSAEKTEDKDLPAGGKIRMTMEQYLVDGNMYQKMEIPGMGEPQWIKISRESLPDLQALIEQSRNTTGLPPGLKDIVHYQYLGDDMENGRKAHRIVCYGRIDDWQTLMQALPSGLTPEIEQALSQVSGVLRSVSFWSKYAVGVDDSLVYDSETTCLIAFGDEFQGETIPLDTLTVKMKLTDYHYNSGVSIRVPDEALMAPEIPLTPSEAVIAPSAG